MNSSTEFKKLKLYNNPVNPDCGKTSHGSQNRGHETGRSERPLGAIEGSDSGALGIYAKLRTPPLKNSPKLPTLDGIESVEQHKMWANSVKDIETGEVVFLGQKTKRESINEARRVRDTLQRYARQTLYGFHKDGVPKNEKGKDKHHRTCTCGVVRTSPTVQLVKSKTSGKVHYSGLTTCANARTCPVCAAPINERKGNEMRLAANQTEAMGLHMSMLTFTAPHTAKDKISELVEKISEALSGFWRGAPATKFKREFGIIGNVRSFEIRYGEHGWHPHFHIIIFSKHRLPKTKWQNKGKRRVVNPVHEQDHKWQWILERWQNMCVAAGLDMPNQYGMDIQGGRDAGEYITKFGSDGEILKTAKGAEITWDMADEMTKGNTKKGVKGSWGPWDILSRTHDKDLSEDERKKAALLFLDYARAMAGKAQIKWSRNLRAQFGLSKKQPTDEEIIAQQIDKCDLLCHIMPSEWVHIFRMGLSVPLRELAENGTLADVSRMLGNIAFDSIHESKNSKAEEVREKFVTSYMESFKSRTESDWSKDMTEAEKDAVKYKYSLAELDGRRDKKVADYYRESVIAPDMNKDHKPAQRDLKKYQVQGIGTGQAYITNDKVDKLANLDVETVVADVSDPDFDGLPDLDPVFTADAVIDAARSEAQLLAELYAGGATVQDI